jgi:thiamine-phosphate pyrophosphorylase
LGGLPKPDLRFRLYLITDNALDPCELLARCDRALSADSQTGEIALQLRYKSLGARDLLALARDLRELCTRRGALLFVNDRIDIALACGADGVHLPTNGVPPQHARRAMGESRLIGVSTHRVDEVEQAVDAGADFVVYGPVFAPFSKTTGYAPPRGVDSLRRACKAVAKPVFALGGVTAARIIELRDTGIAGAATIGSVFRAADPASAVNAMLDALRQLANPIVVDKF